MTGEDGRTLITGGAGFIGSHTAEQLVGGSHQLRILDNLSSGALSNLENCMKTKRVEFIQGDIRDPSILDQSAMRDVDCVVHLAAIVDLETCLRNPRLAEEVNEGGTLNLLESARNHDVTTFVYASSAAVYGETARLPVSEENEPSPLSIYGETKLKGERYCLQYMREYGMRVVSLRFFNVFGPRQTARQYGGVITEFMKRLNVNQPPIIYGDGAQTRDFVNVNDVAQAILAASNATMAQGVFNIGTGKETSISSLADTLIKVSHRSSIHPTYAPERVHEIKRSVANIGKASLELHFRPATNLERDLGDLWKWHLDHADKGRLENR
jgi:nucleoside-diphosphate-sugar epimerase